MSAAIRGVVTGTLVLALATPVMAQVSGSLAITTSINGDSYCDLRVAFTEFHLVPRDDATRPSGFRTDARGAAMKVAPAGTFWIVSSDTVLSSDACLAWRVPVTVPARGRVDVALTNENATVVGRVAEPDSARIDATHEAYERHQGAVVWVSAGAQHGTGILVEPAGLVLTDAAVVAVDSAPIVEIDLVTRVRGTVLSVDADHRVAVLRVPPSAVRGRPLVPLTHAAAVEDGSWLALVGASAAGGRYHTATRLDSWTGRRMERGHLRTLPGALVVAHDSVPVGMLASVDRHPCATPTPNLVTAADLAAVVSSVAPRLAAQPPLDAPQLPPWPAAGFSAARLTAVVDSADPDDRKAAEPRALGKFTVIIRTPVTDLLQARHEDAELRRTIDRGVRESRGAVAACWAAQPRPPERRKATKDLPAMVELFVGPRYSGDADFLVLGVPTGGHLFDGDFDALTLFRNGTPVAPILGGAYLFVDTTRNAFGEVADTVHAGWFGFPAEVLAPDANGAPPSIVVHLRDRRRPSEPSCGALEPSRLAVLWNGFEAAFAGEGTFIRANHKRKPLTPRLSAKETCSEADRHVGRQASR